MPLQRCSTVEAHLQQLVLQDLLLVRAHLRGGCRCAMLGLLGLLPRSCYQIVLLELSGPSDLRTKGRRVLRLRRGSSRGPGTC